MVPAECKGVQRMPIFLAHNTDAGWRQGLFSYYLREAARRSHVAALIAVQLRPFFSRGTFTRPASARKSSARLGMRSRSSLLIGPPSRPNLDNRPIRHQLPDLLDVVIGTRDTSSRPVSMFEHDAKPSPAIRRAVNHDLAARPDSQPPGTSAVGGVRIRHMQRQVVLAVRVAAIDRVQPFGRFFVPLPLLRAVWIRSEADVIRAKRLAVSEESELA